MKVLFIGGTGIISSACSALAVERGVDLTILNRGINQNRPAPQGARLLQSDIRNLEETKKVLDGNNFDVVVDWVAYTPEHIQNDIKLFKGQVGQYVFISSASAYQVPPVRLPITESTPLDNPFWQYSRDKIACEDLLVQANRKEKFPVTIVRPSHTYDKTLLPFRYGYTVIDRMRQGKEVIVEGDGTSLWTMTHHTDFARGFVPLLGNPQAIGDVFHITSDEWLTWNQIYTILGHAAGTEPKLVHIPSELIAAYDPDWGSGLLGDKAHSKIFDNAKIKRLVPGFICEVPFVNGAAEVIGWYDADPARQVVDEKANATMDRLLDRYRTIWP
ncbi:MAG TPA: SDR family oxidoreductase [Longilinea sp.]|nr:SDR family oxidoreductase [Longilinea sp.]